MSKRSILPQTRRHIWLYDEDWEFMLQMWGRDSPSRVGVSVAIRELIHRRIGQIKQSQVDELDEQREVVG